MKKFLEEYSLSIRLFGLISTFTFLGFAITNAKEIDNLQLKYNYCEEINKEIVTIAKYNEDLLVEAKYTEIVEESSENSSDSKKSTNEELIAEIDKVFSNDIKERQLKESNSAKSSISTTEVSTTTSIYEPVADSVEEIVNYDLSTGERKTVESTTKSSDNTNDKSTKVKSKSSGTLKRGADADIEITKSSIKNNSSDIAKDNAGNTYKKGELIGNFYITGYCSACNDPKGTRATASGKTATAGITVAVNKNQIPLGTKIIIGDHVYIAEDVHGNKNYDRVADIYFGSNSCGEEPLISNVPIYIAEKY